MAPTPSTTTPATSGTQSTSRTQQTSQEISSNSHDSYEGWLQLVSEVEDPNYYVNMLRYSNEILDSIKMGTRKQDMAATLNISTSKFSTILPLLIAYTLLNKDNV